MYKTLLPTLVFASICCILSSAFADEKGKPQGATARGIVVEEIQNPDPQFSVRVSVDRSDRTYHEDDLVTATVQSSRAGYLYLLYCDAAGDVFAIYPNKFQQSNKISAQQTVLVPAPQSNFQFRVSSPFGTEVLKAIVTDKPVSAKSLPDLTKSNATKLTTAEVTAFRKGITVEAKLQASTVDVTVSKIEDWAEHAVEITTLARGTENKTRAPRRIFIGIGISDYKSPAIRDLAVCHRDAECMKQLMTSKCGVTESSCLLLLNENASQSNVTKLFCETLPQQTIAGDTILIYWSGHGGQCADQGGDEKDGLDEYLPYHDSVFGENETMLMDDTFGRWLQRLDGRKVVVILDACHSGGQANMAKAVGAMGWQPFDFASNEFARVKDIGQSDSAVLASSVSEEASRERVEGDLSVMTYYIIEAIATAKDPVMLDKLVDSVTPSVNSYIQARFPGAKQTMFFQNDLAGSLELNPKAR
jgi:hypothetical protein